MLGGAAGGGGRSRPPCELTHDGVGRYGVYSLFPAQPPHRPAALHKVTESLFSTSVSAFGAPTPPPGSPYSPLQLDLLKSYSHHVLLDHPKKDLGKMEEAKLGKQCLSDSMGCCGPGNEVQRQMLENVTSIMQPLTIKTEHAAKRACNSCLTSSPKKVIHGVHGMESGCSRTNPVAWVTVPGQGVHVQVKREPQHMHMSELVAVKLEQSSPGTKPDQQHAIPTSLNNGSIPVGIAVARQRVGDASILAALSAQKDTQHRMHDLDAAAMTVGVTGVGGVGGALLHCDERALGWPVPHPPPPQPSALWQYPAQVSMESMMVGGMGVGVGMGGVGGLGGGGYQLVREPTSGALLLLPAPPDLPQTVLWGGYPSTPLLLPPPAPPAPLAHSAQHLQLLGGDLLTSATLQHTQTHSTRLVALSAPDKRKQILQPLLTPHALIKIEPDPPQDKQQFAQEPAPMLSHVYYQQPEFAPEQACRSQATSPVAPLTPPPDAPEPAHRDASNQTDAQLDEEDDAPNHADDDERDVACVGVAHSQPTSDDEPQDASPRDDCASPTFARPAMCVAPVLDSSTIDNQEDSSSEGLTPSAVVGAVEKAIDAIEREEALADTNSSSVSSHDLVIDSDRASPASHRVAVDVSGLELLSNSIEQFERTTPSSMPVLDPLPLTVDTRTPASMIIKSSPKSPHSIEFDLQRRFEFPHNPTTLEQHTKPSLGGLGLLCALAEQRFMEEVVENPTERPFVKSELLSPADRKQPHVVEFPENKERRHTRDEDLPNERSRKRNREGEERVRNKFDKIRRHKIERESGSDDGELAASWRRVATCGCGLPECPHVPSPAAMAHAMEEDMCLRLADLQRQCDEKRAQLHALVPPSEPSTPSAPSTPSPSMPSPSAPSPDSSDRGSSKKRKVGRPRKVSSPDSTETIVAKKPKSKSSLVGYLLAKSSLKGGIVCSRTEPSREEPSRTSKVRPKLKAEPKLKEFSEEDDSEWGLARSASSSMESLHEVRLKNREKTDRLARKHSRDEIPELEFALRRASASSDSDRERRKAKKRRKSYKSKERQSEKEPQEAQVPAPVSRCTLTEALLDTAPRVLTAMGGLFYAGKLSAVQAPDVYAITLDGERGNKPHILSREETLRDAIVEVTPAYAAELPSGTRVCAYWSQQYRCLYPGTVAETPDPREAKFVPVEFDDGDSGRISIEDIRLLEPNYPVVEYDPNPLLTLGKRRRNTSANSTEDKRSHVPIQIQDVKSSSSATAVSEQKPNTQKSLSDSEDRHRDRKKLKKHRKEKLKRLLSGDVEDNSEAVDFIKKKKKKHKCCGDHCKHRRHHKKHHRKHRKRHHSSCKDHSSSSGDDQHRHKSSSDCLDSNKSNEDSVDSNDQLSTLIAVEKSPDDKMKTVIKKAVLSKKSLVKNAVLDFSNLCKNEFKDEVKQLQVNEQDNLKDSGIGLEVDEESPAVAVIKKKTKKRTVSSTSAESAAASAGASKMAAFLPGGALWSWCGAAYRRTARPRHRKLFYKAIQRGEEVLNVGDSAVFLSTGRPDRPYIGRILALWEARASAMAVKVQWFYHPEETVGCPDTLHYPGGLFESPHTDENDVQTISHKCEVLPLPQYKQRMGDDTLRYSLVYDNNDLYYLAGHYDPTQQTISMQPDIPFAAKETTQ